MKKSSNISNLNNSSINFCGALTIAFIVLKLTNVINWSWLWVLSPLWISVLLVATLCIAIAFAKLIEDKIQDLMAKRYAILKCMNCNKKTIKLIRNSDRITCECGEMMKTVKYVSNIHRKIFGWKYQEM